MHLEDYVKDALTLGYDQSQRETCFNIYNPTKLIVNKECDCSSLSGAIAVIQGFMSPSLWKGLYTGNAKERLLKSRYIAIPFDGERFTNCRTGYIILGSGHMAYVTRQGKLLQAESDERGKSSGGKPGNQTGKEVYLRDFYQRLKGWHSVFAPMADSKLLAKLPKATSQLKLLKHHARDMASFVGTCDMESGGFKFVKEIKGETKSYAPYYGRGYIQLTGLSNYKAFKSTTKIDVVKNPSYLESHPWDGAIWYFDYRKLWGRSFAQISAIVNLGSWKPLEPKLPSGYRTRLAAYRKWLKTLSQPYGIEELDVDGILGDRTRARICEHMGVTFSVDISYLNLELWEALKYDATVKDYITRQEWAKLQEHLNAQAGW